MQNLIYLACVLLSTLLVGQILTSWWVLRIMNLMEVLRLNLEIIVSEIRDHRERDVQVRKGDKKK